jgi:flavin-dependent dehydrogenase
MVGGGAVPARADVVVVGGGPAGSITAALLARDGHDVVILDRAEFPRSKACGESINPGVVRELQELGLLPSILALPHNRITRWRVHPPRGAPFEGRFPADEFALAMGRSAFDSALLDFARKCGASVHTCVRVTDLTYADDCVCGVATAEHGQVGARLVVGADGLRSVVARRLELLRRRPRLRKLALTGHVTGIDLDGSTGILSMTTWGCIGIAPLGGGIANVVVVLERGSRDFVGGDPNACFDRLLSGSDYLRGATRAADVIATGPFDWPTRSVTADGALVVGDAAGYFDPLTGQGIFRAIRGARHAAEVAGECLRSGRLTAAAMRPYSRRHRRAFATGAAVQRLIEVAVAHPPLFSACAAVLRSFPSLANRLLSITGDVPPNAGDYRPSEPVRSFSV